MLLRVALPSAAGTYSPPVVIKAFKKTKTNGYNYIKRSDVTPEYSNTRREAKHSESGANGRDKQSVSSSSSSL